MATNVIFKCPDDMTRSVDVGKSRKPGEVAHCGKAFVGVSLNGTGDYVQPDTVIGGANGFTISGIKPNANIEPNAHFTTLALGGAFLLPVTGVDATTTAGTPVYITDDDILTLSEDDGKTTPTKYELFGAVYNNGDVNTATACAVFLKGAI